MGDEQIDDVELRMLMTRYQRADPSALDELVRRVSPPLLRYFGSSPFVRDEAEDLLQNCWLRIHSSRAAYNASEPVMPWLYAIARHTRLDAYRKRRRLTTREVLVAAVPEVRLPDKPDAQGDAFETMISKLPEAQREVLIMLKVSGMSLQEVARATSSTVGAVKQKASRAYATLRGILTKDTSNARSRN